MALHEVVLHVLDIPVGTKDFKASMNATNDDVDIYVYDPANDTYVVHAIAGYLHGVDYVLGTDQRYAITSAKTHGVYKNMSFTFSGDDRVKPVAEFVSIKGPTTVPLQVQVGNWGVFYDSEVMIHYSNLGMQNCQAMTDDQACMTLDELQAHVTGLKLGQRHGDNMGQDTEHAPGKVANGDSSGNTRHEDEGDASENKRHTGEGDPSDSRGKTHEGESDPSGKRHEATGDPSKASEGDKIIQTLEKEGSSMSPLLLAFAAAILLLFVVLLVIMLQRRRRSAARDYTYVKPVVDHALVSEKIQRAIPLDEDVAFRDHRSKSVV